MYRQSLQQKNSKGWGQIATPFQHNQIKFFPCGKKIHLAIFRTNINVN